MNSGTDPFDGRHDPSGNGHRPTSPLLFVIAATLALIVVFIVVVFIVKSNEGDDVEATDDTVAESTVPGVGDDPVSTNPDGADTSDDADGRGRFSEDPDATDLSASMSEASTTPVSVAASGSGVAHLSDVRVATHDDFDRVVFEFEGPMPGYEISYTEGPVYQDGSGSTVEVVGGRVLSVRMTSASGVDLSGASYRETYTGPKRMAGPADPDSGDGGSVAEVVEAGDFEAQLTWVLGVLGEKPFKVSELSAPTRLVIDVAH